MKKFRGFKLGRKFVKVSKWTVQPRRRQNRFHLLDPSSRTRNALSKICSFARFLRRGAKGLCGSNSGTGCIQLGKDGGRRLGVPQGHVAVYVGESVDDTRRVVVPVIYFNHPLFGELLKEAEHEYGFNHCGGITIPCRVSEFEKVQTRVAATDHCRRRQHRRHLLRLLF
ncbi:hypothetical protein SLE2022_089310 [Rubroshorea leprosula]